MFTYPYQIIKLKLETDVTELRLVEWYTGQDDLADKNSSIKAAPLVLIQFPPVETENLSSLRVQSAVTFFDVILITESLHDGDKRMKKDSPNDHMRIFDKIFRSLQGFGAKASYLPEFVGLLDSPLDQRMFNSLSRIAATPPHAPLKALMRSVQRFQGKFYDHASLQSYTTITPKPPLGVTVQLDSPL